MVVTFSCRNKAGIPSLKETFSFSDKDPFGTYAAHEQVKQLFYQNEVTVKKTRLSTALKDNYDNNSLYINISKNFFLTPDELSTMLSFVSRGNSMFISSENIDTSFLNTVGFPQPKDFKSYGMEMRTTTVQLDPMFYNDNSRFGYFYLPADNYFSTWHGEYLMNTLGSNESGKANFVVLFYGKGRFYLHCEPRVFSNYFLLQQDNYRYLQNIFSFIPAVPEHIFWDDFYNKRNYPPNEESDKNGLSVLLKYPAMAWAFWLTLLSLLLYIIFGGKRRQRIVKPLPENVNTSVAFTETVGQLYLQKKDNRNMADKMILYFLEHIRNQYFLNTNQFNDDFITVLSRKSNVSKEQTTKLFRLMNDIQQSAAIDDQQLLSLNQQLEQFYKYRK